MRPMPRLLLVTFSLLLATGCGHLVYSSGPYRGQVLDAETQQPLVGAVVLAIWYREVSFIPFAAHSPAEDYHDALEILTDAQGEFTIPAKTHLTPIGKIREPEFVIYYPGYGYYNYFQVHPVGKEITVAYEQRFFHVELRKWKSREERLRNLSVRPVGRVPLDKMPNLTRLVNVERIEMDLSPLPMPGRK